MSLKSRGKKGLLMQMVRGISSKCEGRNEALRTQNQVTDFTRFNISRFNME